METITTQQYQQLQGNKQSEEVMCQQFKAHLDFLINSNQILVKELVYAHQDNGQRSGNKKQRMIAGSRAKKMGVKKGLPDYLLLWGIEEGERDMGFIEYKTEKGTLKPEQKQFKQFCNKYGFKHAIARSVTDGINILKEWGVIKQDYNHY